MAEAKKASLTHVDWNYDNTAEAYGLLRQAGERAAAKARVLAESVGATLSALHAVREERSEPLRDESQNVMVGGLPLRARQLSVAEELSGLDLAPKRKLNVSVFLAYTLK